MHRHADGSKLENTGTLRVDSSCHLMRQGRCVMARRLAAGCDAGHFWHQLTRPRGMQAGVPCAAVVCSTLVAVGAGYIGPTMIAAAPPTRPMATRPPPRWMKWASPVPFTSWTSQPACKRKPRYSPSHPNGRVSAIVNRDDGVFAVCETGAIAVGWAAKAGVPPRSVKNRSRVGEANVFHRHVSEKILLVFARYQGESRRLCGVLGAHLAHHEWPTGDGSTAGIAKLACVHRWPGGRERHARQALGQATLYGIARGNRTRQLAPHTELRRNTPEAVKAFEERARLMAITGVPMPVPEQAKCTQYRCIFAVNKAVMDAYSFNSIRRQA